MADTQKNIKKNKDVAIKQPNWLYYTLVCLLSKFIFKLAFKRKIVNNLPKIDGNVLVISNHSGAFDVAFMFSALYPKRINLVTGRDLFTKKLGRLFMKPLHMICKNQFALDINSIRTIKKAVDNGCNIGLYPEGKMSIDGKNLHYISPSIIKFIKFLNIPVVITRVEGSYLLKPRWYKGIRVGKIHQTVDLLFTKEDIKTLSNDELYKKTVEALTINDLEYQIKNNVRFKTKAPAKNVETVLYKCPQCQAEYENTSTNTQLICKKCGNTVTFDEYGHIVAEKDSIAFDRMDLWYNFQRKSVKAEIIADDFFISKKVLATASVDNSSFVDIGRGEVYIDSHYIGYKGTKNGEPFELKSPIKSTFTLVIKDGEGIDLTDNTTIYRFMFVDKKFSFKYGLYVEEIFRKLNNLN